MTTIETNFRALTDAELDTVSGGSAFSAAIDSAVAIGQALGIAAGAIGAMNDALNQPAPCHPK